MSDPIIKEYKTGTVVVERIDKRIQFSFWPHAGTESLTLSLHDILELMRTGNAIEMQKIIADARLDKPKD